MKILITGGTGFLGRHLVEFWKGSSHSISVLARKIDPALFEANIGCLEIDITVKEDVQAAIIFLQPDVVIHAAATSKPNDCEANKEQAFLTNVTATEYIVDACKSIGAKLVFVSTDFVFGHNGPYTEEDNCEPVNYYGETKMLAEKLIIASGVHYLIVRTVLVVGEKLTGGPNTFLHWVKETLETGKTVCLYTDQQRNITYVGDLCNGIDTIIKTDYRGIIHLAGNEIVTPYSLAQQVATYFGYDQQSLKSVTRHQRPELAMRPKRSVLKIEKAMNLFNYIATPLIAVLQKVFPASS